MRVDVVRSPEECWYTQVSFYCKGPGTCHCYWSLVPDIDIVSRIDLRTYIYIYTCTYMFQIYMKLILVLVKQTAGTTSPPWSLSKFVTECIVDRIAGSKGPRALSFILRSEKHSSSLGCWKSRQRAPQCF